MEKGVFDQFPKYHMKILLGDFNAKVGREDIFKPTMMEAARTSETLVNFYQTTRCYNPEDSNLQLGRGVCTKPVIMGLE
jgi:hypothetical protein